MGHPDTCATSGNTDASGCGLWSSFPDGGQGCTWADGARLEERTLPDGTKTFEYQNAHGDVCAKGTTDFSLSSGAGSQVISFPDGQTFDAAFTTGPGGVQTITCPDGTKSATFDNDLVATCLLSIACCNEGSPPPKC